MTVIAWDGKSLAADRQRTNADAKSQVTKIFEVKNPDTLATEIIGCTGDEDALLSMIDWYTKKGKGKDTFPEIQATDRWARLIVARPGKLVYFDRSPHEIQVNEAFAAFGSGRDYALGAMSMGADAKTAVEIASRYCVYCGLGVDVLMPRF